MLGFLDGTELQSATQQLQQQRRGRISVFNFLFFFGLCLVIILLLPGFGIVIAYVHHDYVC